MWNFKMYFLLVGLILHKTELGYWSYNYQVKCDKRILVPCSKKLLLSSSAFLGRRGKKLHATFSAAPLSVVWYFDTHVRSPRAKILSGSKKREGKYRERAGGVFMGRAGGGAASTPSQEKILAADSSEKRAKRRY
jgi:hypothetical protein